jgi:hypothetical protein
MATITIDKKPFEVQEQVASLLRETQDQNEFYRKVLGWIAWNKFQGPPMSLAVVERLAEETIRLYR